VEARSDGRVRRDRQVSACPLGAFRVLTEVRSDDRERALRVPAGDCGRDENVERPVDRRALAAAVLGAAIAALLTPLTPPGLPIIAATAAVLVGWTRR